MKTETRHPGAWIRYVVGAVIGAVGGAIGAVNVMIYSGVEGGYEAGISELFGHNVFADTAALVFLVAGPLIGVLAASWIRRSG